MEGRRAIFNGELFIKGVSIPISLFHCYDAYGLSGQLFHADCGGKIREKRYCELHPELDEVVSFSAIAVGDKLVPLDSELKNRLLERNASFTVHSAHKMNALADLLSDRSLVPIQTLELAPQTTKDVDAALNNALWTLLDRMRIKKRFLLCSVGVCGMNRYGVLLPSGQFIVTAYQEELRERVQVCGKKIPDLAKRIDQFLISDWDFPAELSLATYRERVWNFFNEVVLSAAKKPRRNKKKQLTDKEMAKK